MRRQLTKMLLTGFTELFTSSQTDVPMGPPTHAWSQVSDLPLRNRVLVLILPERLVGDDYLTQQEASLIRSIIRLNPGTYATASELHGLLNRSLGALRSNDTRYYATLVFMINTLSPTPSVQPTYYAIGPFREMLAPNFCALSTEDLFKQACTLWLLPLSGLTQDDTTTTADDLQALQANHKDNLRTLFTVGGWLDQTVLDHYLQQLPRSAQHCIMPVSFYNYQIENGFYKKNGADTLDAKKLGTAHCFLPIYHHSHYILVEIINTTNNTDIYIYNSLTTIETRSVQAHLSAVIAHFAPSKRISCYTPVTPHQTNSDDCGYFVAWFVELLLKDKKQLFEYGKLSGGPLTFFNMAYMRERMQFTLAGHGTQLPPLLPPTPCDLKKESLVMGKK